MDPVRFELPADNATLNVVQTADWPESGWSDFAQEPLGALDRRDCFYVVPKGDHWGLITQTDEYLLPKDRQWHLKFAVTHPARGPGGCSLVLSTDELHSDPDSVWMSMFMVTIEFQHEDREDLLTLGRKMAKVLSLFLHEVDLGRDQ